MTALLKFPDVPAPDLLEPAGNDVDIVASLRGEVARLTDELARATADMAALEALCNEDVVTGLLNRRGFLRDVSRAIAFTKRYDVTAVLLLLDLNAFKPINDRHGHVAGDLALQHVGDVLRAHLRGSDSIGRLGGDEFGVLLWQADEEVGRIKAASLEVALDDTPFLFDGYKLAVTGSIGTAALRQGDDEETIMDRADRAMYTRKKERTSNLLNAASIRR